jgi:FMN reductase
MTQKPIGPPKALLQRVWHDDHIQGRAYFDLVFLGGGVAVTDVVMIAGSPSAHSRVGAILEVVGERLQGLGCQVHGVRLRDLPPTDLLHGDRNSAEIRETHERLAAADAVIVGTPIYKASYAGLLKVYLDLLPERALQDKVVWPIATGGTIAHLLAVEYALRPVLTVLGASVILPTVFVQENQVQLGVSPSLDPDARGRLEAGLGALMRALARPWSGLEAAEGVKA